MSTEIPIACTLSPDGFTARMGLIDALAVDGLIDRTDTERGVRVRLRDTPEIEQRVRELVAAESSAARSWNSRSVARTTRSCSTSPALRTHGP